jgi:hypothetical protein
MYLRMWGRGREKGLGDGCGAGLKPPLRMRRNRGKGKGFDAKDAKVATFRYVKQTTAKAEAGSQRE